MATLQYRMNLKVFNCYTCTHTHTFRRKSAICTILYIIVTEMSKFGKRVGYVPEVFELLPTRQYLCDFQCGKVFKNRLPYEMHLQRVHGVVSQGNGFDFFKCPIENCDYNGGRLNLLRRHYQCHHMEKNYSCSNCDRKFLLESQFIKHRCDVREYGCPRCFKIFKVLNRRNRHVKICTKRELVVPEPIIDIKVDFGTELIQSCI